MKRIIVVQVCDATEA